MAALMNPIRKLLGHFPKLGGKLVHDKKKDGEICWRRVDSIWKVLIVAHEGGYKGMVAFPLGLGLKSKYDQNM